MLTKKTHKKQEHKQNLKKSHKKIGGAPATGNLEIDIPSLKSPTNEIAFLTIPKLDTFNDISKTNDYNEKIIAIKNFTEQIKLSPTKTTITDSNGKHIGTVYWIDDNNPDYINLQKINKSNEHKINTKKISGNKSIEIKENDIEIIDKTKYSSSSLQKEISDLTNTIEAGNKYILQEINKLKATSPSGSTSTASAAAALVAASASAVVASTSSHEKFILGLNIGLKNKTKNIINIIKSSKTDYDIKIEIDWTPFNKDNDLMKKIMTNIAQYLSTNKKSTSCSNQLMNEYSDNLNKESDQLKRNQIRNDYLPKFLKCIIT